MAKRLTDMIASALGLLLLTPVLLGIALLIRLTSRGPVFYRQQRVGKNGRLFRIYKFRTMYTGSDKRGKLTVGEADHRITPVGRFLRKYKLDEWPQLINVLKGEMSLVGPRPEVPEYVAHYSEQQKRVLTVKPGITDYASLEFVHENKLLQQYADPEKAYRKHVIPRKIALNLQYIERKSWWEDIRIIYRTLTTVFKSA